VGSTPRPALVFRKHDWVRFNEVDRGGEGKLDLRLSRDGLSVTGAVEATAVCSTMGRVEPSEIALWVRTTARVSVALYSLALAALAVEAYRGREPRSALRLFEVFILSFTIHFGFVGWLTVATAGQNIERRGGPLLTSLVGVAFYVASFAVLTLAPRRRLPAWLGATTIWLMILGTYVGRIPRNPAFALPVALATVALGAFLFGPSMRRART
jgi:hypothetical protein